jgi:hypothetical protein
MFCFSSGGKVKHRVFLYSFLSRDNFSSWPRGTSGSSRVCVCVVCCCVVEEEKNEGELSG